MLRYAAYLLVFSFLLACGPTPAHAEKRVALVIGNSDYEYAPALKNPRNDAEAISAVLTKLGFDVVTGINLTHLDFFRTIGQFRKKLKDAKVALFFYAGHGLQVNGQNYLAPVDAELQFEDSLEFEAVTLKAILRLMEREARTNIVFLDSCRDNPLARNLARGMGTRSTTIGRGLARVETGIGTMISFATQPGNVALDGAGKNSPFTAALLNHIETPGLDIANLMRAVRLDVLTRTKKQQVPWSNSSLTGSFMFNDLPKEEAEPAPKPVVTAPPEFRFDRSAIDLALWQSAKDSGTRQAYEIYLRKYPEGTFAPMAQMKLDDIARAKEAQTKQKDELEAARKKRAEADQASRKAEARQKSTREAAGKKQAEAVAEAAKRKAEAERRQHELAALEKKQAEARARLAKEREELAQRLKTLEEQAKTRALAKKEIELKLAALLPPGQQPEPDATAKVPLDPHTMTLVLQNELKRVGCEPGKVDGKWGKQGRKALARFNVYAKLKLPTDAPTMDALEALKGAKESACPLVCGPQFNKTGGECVKKRCRSGQWLNKRGQCVRVAVKRPQYKPRPANNPAPRTRPAAKPKTKNRYSDECFVAGSDRCLN